MAGRVFRGGLKGARGTAVAVAALTVLTASQAPGAAPARASAPAQQASGGHGPSVSGDSPYRTELPPLRARKGEARRARVSGGALPETVFAAYWNAEAELARTTPGCRLRWQLAAAIGQVESGHARGGRVTADGTTVTPILGPRLDGAGFALIRDSDGGAYDQDTVYDRAVGPMQFIPSTWARWGADGNGDGRADPDNVFDAALAAGRYLCAGGRDLSDPADLDRAILGYNHSRAYLRTVLAWYAYFLSGHRVVPDLSRDTLGAARAVAARRHARARAAPLADAVRPPQRAPAPDTDRARLARPDPVPSGGRPGGAGGARAPRPRHRHGPPRRRSAAR